MPASSRLKITAVRQRASTAAKQAGSPIGFTRTIPRAADNADHPSRPNVASGRRITDNNRALLHSPLRQPRNQDRVGAEYSATLCDLGVFIDQPTEPISSDDLDVLVDRSGNGLSGLAWFNARGGDGGR